jgi:hypothetical protein
MQIKLSSDRALPQSHEPQVTTDHTVIRQWVEERGGHPGLAKHPEVFAEIALRIDLPGQGRAEPLAEISWGEFFQRFEEGRYAFAFRHTTIDGERSNFHEIIRREPYELE